MSDACTARDSSKQYFCHVCIDNEVHYARIDADEGQAVLYGTSMPECATLAGNSEDLRQFAVECFPAGLGYLRNQFFPGHNTDSCDTIPTVEQKARKVSAAVWWIIMVAVLVSVAVVCLLMRQRGAAPEVTKVVPLRVHQL